MMFAKDFREEAQVRKILHFGVAIRGEGLFDFRR
jgi:hypothetical protein